MRLPFGLGRRSSSGDGGSSDGTSASFDTGIAVAAPASGRAWASLPPIQRTAGDMPLVAAPGSFAEGLPGSQGLPPIVQPLGHEVSNLATSGLVVARVRAVTAAPAGSIPAPVQRRAARAGQLVPTQVEPVSAPEAVSTPEAVSAPEGRSTAEVPVSDVPQPMPFAAPEAPAASAASAASIASTAPMPLALPVAAPIRTMPTISRQSIHVPERPLTSAASAARPAAAQRAAAAAEAAASGAAAVPMPVSGGMRRVPSGTTPAMPVVSRPAVTAAPTTSETAPALPAVALISSAQRSASSSGAPASLPAPITRSRLGLGEPMTSLPASARPVGAPAPGPVVSRSTTAGPMPVSAAALIPKAQRSAADDAESTSDGAAALPTVARTASPRSAPATVSPELPLGGVPLQRPASSVARPTAQRLPALPHLPVARPTVARAAPGVDAVHDAAHSTPGQANVARASGAPASTAMRPEPTIQAQRAPEIRPIAAANPIRPSVVLQRSVADVEDDAPGGQPDMPSPWWAPAAEPRSNGRVSAVSGADGGVTSIQRSAGFGGPSVQVPPASLARPFDPQASSPSIARAAKTGAVQRAATSGTRQLPPARGTAPDPVSRIASAALTAASGPITASEPALAASAPFQGITTPSVVQASAEASPWPSVQRAPAAPSPAPMVQREGGVGSAVGGSSGAHHAGTGGGRSHSEKDLEELSQMLFSRIRTRLRADLIHDREAKGLTFDNV